MISVLGPLLNKLKLRSLSLPITSVIYRRIVYAKHLYYFKKNPKQLANISYKRVFKQDINWLTPSDLIEKIIWMQFNIDTTIWTKLADKYLAREYVKESGYGHLLNRLYGSYKSVQQIDFRSLPDKFVIKPNNACEEVILVKDKSKLNISRAKRKIKRWLKYKYGVMNAQLHYLSIPPCIIVEEYLENKNQEENSLIDYKLTCFNGIPESILVVSERNPRDHTYKLNLYDLNWSPMTKFLCQHVNDKEILRPDSLDQMIHACRILGSNIPYVRIDFYDIEGKPYFGEFTFTTGFGYFTKEYYNLLGTKLKIDPTFDLKTENFQSRL
jgi:hypothetical protein